MGMTEQHYLRLAARIATAPSADALALLTAAIEREPPDDLQRTLLRTAAQKQGATPDALGKAAPDHPTPRVPRSPNELVIDDRWAERPPYRRGLEKEWDESQHPREPAGSPEGGRFAGGASGAMTLAGEPVQLTPLDVGDLLAALRAEDYDQKPKAATLPKTAALKAGDHPDAAALERYEVAIAPLDRERALVLDKAGVVVKEVAGTDDSVRLDIEPGQAWYMIHNHPGGAGISPSDLGANIFHKVDGVRAVSDWADGRRVTYQVTGLRGFKPEQAEAVAESLERHASYIQEEYDKYTLPGDRTPLPFDSALEAEVRQAERWWDAGKHKIYEYRVGSKEEARDAARSMVVWREHTHQALTNWAKENSKSGVRYQRTLTAAKQPARRAKKDWDESQHPREPAGSPAGGEFASGGDAEGESPYFRAAIDGPRAAKANDPMVPQITTALISRFGVTHDPRQAGFIAPDGHIISFSGTASRYGQWYSHDDMAHMVFSQLHLEQPNPEPGGSKYKMAGESDLKERGFIRVELEGDPWGHDNLGVDMHGAPTAPQLRALDGLLSEPWTDPAGTNHRIEGVYLEYYHPTLDTWWPDKIDIRNGRELDAVLAAQADRSYQGGLSPAQFLSEKDWDPEKHPRQAAGSPEGGEFVETGDVAWDNGETQTGTKEAWAQAGFVNLPERRPREKEWDYAERLQAATLQQPEAVFNAVKAQFEVGGPLKDTGWILPDGTRLNFYRHAAHGASDWMPHGEIGIAMPGFGASVTAIDAFRGLGAIRVDSGTQFREGRLIVDLAKEPTEPQWAALDQMRSLPNVSHIVAGGTATESEREIPAKQPDWKDVVSSVLPGSAYSLARQAEADRWDREHAAFLAQQQEESQRRYRDDAFKEWDESAHPRVPAGSAEGGEFTSADGGGGTAVAVAGYAQLAAEVKDLTIPQRWAWFAQQDRMALANPRVTIPAALAAVRDQLHEDDPRSRVQEAARAELIGADAVVPIRERLDALERDLQRVGAPTGVREELLALVADSYVAQEHEALGRSLGDHGVRHLAQDIEDARAILEVVPGGLGHDPEIGVMLEVAGAFHDTGYLTPPGQLFMDNGHPQWSAAYYQDRIEPLLAQVVGAERAAEVRVAMATHDGVRVDWSPGEQFYSAFRVADNLALFHQEKLPAMVRYVPANAGVLEALGHGDITEQQARDAMADNIWATPSLPQKVKLQLLKASDETSVLLPKFTLGMYAGVRAGFHWQNDHLAVHINRTSSKASLINRIADMGTAQFIKLAKTYGLDEEAARLKSNTLHFWRKGKEVLEFDIAGEPVWKRMLRELAALVLKYDPDQPTARLQTEKEFNPDQPRDALGRWTDEYESAREDAKYASKSELQGTVDWYATNGYDEVNRFLRGKPRGYQEDTVRLIAQMDELYKRGAKVTDQATKVWRGINSLKIAKQFDKVEVGDVIQDRAFLSTTVQRHLADFIATEGEPPTGFAESASRPRASRGVLLEITLPKGARYLQPTERFEGERILNRSAQLRVTGISRAGGITRVQARLAR